MTQFFRVAGDAYKAVDTWPERKHYEGENYIDFTLLQYYLDIIENMAKTVETANALALYIKQNPE